MNIAVSLVLLLSYPIAGVLCTSRVTRLHRCIRFCALFPLRFDRYYLKTASKVVSAMSEVHNRRGEHGAAPLEVDDRKPCLFTESMLLYLWNLSHVLTLLQCILLMLCMSLETYSVFPHPTGHVGGVESQSIVRLELLAPSL
jgi:hypothetical protein